MLAAPQFFPTAEEFRDPIAYIESIRKQGTARCATVYPFDILLTPIQRTKISLFLYWFDILRRKVWHRSDQSSLVCQTIAINPNAASERFSELFRRS